MAIFNTLDSESITVDSTSGGKYLTSTKFRRTDTKRIVAAICQVQSAQIRVTRDTTAPVAATTGVLRNPGDIIVIAGDRDMTAARFIRESSTSATLYVEYIGEEG